MGNKRRTFRFIAAIAWVSVGFLASASAGELDLAATQAAMDKGIAYLFSQQNQTKGDPNFGSWVKPADKAAPAKAASATASNEVKSARSAVWSRFEVGQTALIVYALLESGMSTQDPRVAKALDWLVRQQEQAEVLRGDYMKIFKKLQARPGKLSPRSDDYKKLQSLERAAFESTYNVAFRACALAAACRQNPRRWEKPLQKDHTRLLQAVNDGGYGYVCIPKAILLKKLQKRNTTVDDLRRLPEMFVDQSNSQYGVLGVWAGMQVGLDVPKGYWKLVEKYWVAAQNPDGGWGYTTPPRRAIRQKSYPSMTAAGMATLFLAQRNSAGASYVRCRKTNSVSPALEKSLAWFDAHFAKSMDPKSNVAPPGESTTPASYHLNKYYLYGVERIALASGSRTFDGVDWYRAGVKYLLDTQYQSGKWKGSWTGKWVDGFRLGATAYSVLFLARGQRPIYCSKLRFDGDWNNRPSDLHHIVSWVGEQCGEARGHWQIADIDENEELWHDAPILYLSGSRDPKFTDEQIARLRRFVQQGGTILSVSACNGPGFKTGIRKAYAKMFPAYPLKKAAPDATAYNYFYKIKRPFRLHLIRNGARTLVYHIDDDLSKSWQLRQSKTRRDHFDIMYNILLLNSKRGNLRHRGQRSWPDDAKVAGPAIPIVRGLWGKMDPEPLALEALRRRLAAKDKLAVTILPAAPVESLATSKAKVAFLGGVGPLKPTPAQAKALRAFVAAGGTVVLDAFNSDETFYKDARKMLESQFGPKSIKPILVDDPLYTRKGYEIQKVRYRRASRERLGRLQTPTLEAIRDKGRLAVIVSREDLSLGLLGIEGLKYQGYVPASAYDLMRNLLLETNQPKTPQKTPKSKKP